MVRKRARPISAHCINLRSAASDACEECSPGWRSDVGAALCTQRREPFAPFPWRECIATAGACVLLLIASRWRTSLGQSPSETRDFIAALNVPLALSAAVLRAWLIRESLLPGAFLGWWPLAHFAVAVTVNLSGLWPLAMEHGMNLSLLIRSSQTPLLNVFCTILALTVRFPIFFAYESGVLRCHLFLVQWLDGFRRVLVRRAALQALDDGCLIAMVTLSWWHHGLLPVGLGCLSYATPLLVLFWCITRAPFAIKHSVCDMNQRAAAGERQLPYQRT